MLVLLAAMESEANGLRRMMTVRQTRTVEECRLLTGECRFHDILLVVTGIGREHAEKAAVTVLNDYHPSALISFGFAGALTAQRKPGDIVICTTLVASDEKEEYHPDGDLSSKALPVRVNGNRPHAGKMVTVPRPAASPAERQALVEKYHADVVDMESYWIARQANIKRVPFLAIRAISDTPSDGLPPLDVLGRNGQPSWAKALPYLVSHPRQARSLYNNMKLAENNLNDFLSQLLEQLK